MYMCAARCLYLNSMRLTFLPLALRQNLWALFDPKTIIILSDCSCHSEQHLRMNFSVWCQSGLLFNTIQCCWLWSLLNVWQVWIPMTIVAYRLTKSNDSVRKSSKSNSATCTLLETGKQKARLFLKSMTVIVKVLELTLFHFKDTHSFIMKATKSM